jgi:hypothetical protein
MESAGAVGRGRWSSALGLTLAVIFLTALDALALVFLPMAVMVAGLPAERRVKWLLVAVGLWVFGSVTSAGTMGMLSQGWALMLAAIFFTLTLARPDWGVASRGLAAVGIAMTIGGLALLVTGQYADLDVTIRQHFETVSALTIGDMQTRMPDSAWLADLRGAADQIGALQTRLFPALLALQSLAALALASWWVRRMGRSDSRAFELAPLREFRFPDELIWLLIAALALSILPMGASVDRIALNALVFMGALYALRGLAVFVFLAASSRSIPTMVLGTLALVFLYPVAFTAALLMGVGDTWLDVRRRAAKARPT